MTDKESDARLHRFETLAAGLAHELRNPLSTINITLQLLRESLAAKPGARENPDLRRVDVVLGEAARLEKIVQDFLRLARDPTPSLRSTDVNAVVDDALLLMNGEFRTTGIEVTPQFDRRIPKAPLDESLFRQALLNVFRNAAQAMAKGGVLTVQTRLDGGSFAVDVIDTGQGMAPEVRNRVFDVFFSTKPGGTGLGLPIVRQILELHGGSASCESAPGVGTKITLRAPIA
jgi:two-component system, NtrC family, sensor histidine kinase HydH